jgi:hypothetical protein
MIRANCFWLKTTKSPVMAVAKSRFGHYNLAMRYLFILLLLFNLGFFIWVERYTAAPKKNFTATDPGVTELVLLSDNNKSDSNILADAPVMPVNSGNNSGTDLNFKCYAAGPYENEAGIQSAIEQIKSEVLKYSTRRLTTTQEAGYWVYLPALPSRKEALKKGRDLAAAYVKDYYVVTSGNNENSISLGLYREPFNADNRVTELNSKGFQVEKEIRLEQWPEFWLDFSINEDSEMNVDELSDTNTDIKVNEVICAQNN